MIATSRKFEFSLTVSRQLEFSRLQSQRLARAYEALIPVACVRLNRTEPVRGAGRVRTSVEAPRSSAVGA